jgi:hypothetical protein
MSLEPAANSNPHNPLTGPDEKTVFPEYEPGSAYTSAWVELRLSYWNGKE